MAAVCSSDTPRAAALGATYFIVSPSIARSVFEVVKVLVSTSPRRPVSAACMPNPDRTLEAMSDARARSMAPALARLSMPGMAATVSSTSKPAMERNFMPSAASEAAQAVVAPRCRAVSVNRASSSSSARATAATPAMDCSKSIAGLRAAAIDPASAATPRASPMSAPRRASLAASCSLAQATPARPVASVASPIPRNVPMTLRAGAVTSSTSLSTSARLRSLAMLSYILKGPMSGPAVARARPHLRSWPPTGPEPFPASGPERPRPCGPSPPAASGRRGRCRPWLLPHRRAGSEGLRFQIRLHEKTDRRLCHLHEIHRRQIGQLRLAHGRHRDAR